MTFFISLIIVGVVGWQCYIFFWHTLPGIKRLGNIFPENVDRQMRVYNKDEKDESIPISISSDGRKKKSDVWDAIMSSINKYLRKNNGRVSDFSLIKDIVDRNCDAAEEDVRELVPVPLYTGLVGTMLGIIFGLIALVSSEGLETLLSSEISNLSDVGVGGLLIDVAVAMIGSCVGVGFTIASTMLIRDRVGEVEEHKHAFLSWIQAELLPVVSSSLTATIDRLSRDLMTFNADFRDNSRNMSETVHRVNTATDLQVRMLEAVEQLKSKRVSEASLELYERLSRSSQEIGRLADLLRNSTDYLNEVRLLNQKLDHSEKRMKTLEEMGEYFMRERTNVERIENIAVESVAAASAAVNNSVKQFEINLNKLHNQMESMLEKEQSIFEKKSREMMQVITEINNLSSVKQLISKLNETTKEQNRILQEQAMAARGSNPGSAGIPTWLKVMIATACLTVIGFGLAFLMHYLNVI